jgi:hypothetical protein
MIRRRRHARFPAAVGAAGSDIDALQTDVMRFMAIIGLCLMAVFALVQSIPEREAVKPVQPSRVAVVRPALQQENLQQIRQRILQKKRAQQLQAELDALKSEKDQTQQILAVAQQRDEEVTGQIQQAREARERRENEVIRRSPQQADKPASEKPPPVPEASPAAKPVPDKQGFTLRFASAAALDRLITAGSVSLYGMDGRQAWRLSMEAGRPTVARASLPGWFHEMSAATVPAHYIRSLDNAADGPGQVAIVWGVQLPSATKAAITARVEQQQMQGEQGGTLVIRDDGQVALEE